MSLHVFFFFGLIPVDGIVDSEYVVRINRLLDVVQHFESQRSDSSLHESLSDLTHAMVM